MASQGKVAQIVITAWDSLFGSASSLDDECERLRPVIDELRSQAVPVIVFSERDRTELEPIRQQIGLRDPFITESGSAIFTPADHNPFDPVLGEKEDGYFVEMLGCPYVQARAGLRVIANIVSHPLKGFGDYTVPQLQRAAGLSEAAAHKAKAREFSEPFMTPKAVTEEALRQAAEEMGFGVIWRSPEESRFSELVGAGAGLVQAVSIIVEAYRSQLEADTLLNVVGISDRLAGLAELENVCEQLDNVTWQGVLAGNAEEWKTAVVSLFSGDAD